MHSDHTIIEFVDQLFREAIAKKASDIHVEPFADECRIRYRLDGLLESTTTIPHPFATRITARLKIMAALNIAEKRLPQDGRILLKQNGNIDIRVSTCPTLYGEKIVLRILNTTDTALNIHQLGMHEEQQRILIDALQQPHGFILVTGPTGSGKTITLYSALRYLNHTGQNIATVEDPVEIELPGINQIHVNARIGLTFSTLLRTILRQDPDIIMVGEIRDTETAIVAMQAAQTGHLVLSTLHSNNAIGAITRLQAMNVPSHHIACSLSLIISQHLIPKPGGGRTGVFECLPVTDEIRRMINKHP